MKKLSAVFLLMFVSSFAFANITLPQIIGSKMVIQRGVAAPIWGWGDVGEEVTVTFAGQTKKAKAEGAKGRWEVKLDPLKASADPREMIIKGKNEIKLTDVLVGEVWLASGQSNMEWTFNLIALEERAFAASQKDNKLVRAFHVNQHLIGAVPLDDTIGLWKDCAEMVTEPQISQGISRSVSAIGFFFAVKLQKELGVPVAIIDANWGGLRIEPFISNEGYEAFGLKYKKRNLDMTRLLAKLKKMEALIQTSVAAAEKGRASPLMLDANVFGRSDNFAYNAMIAPVTPFAIKGAIWYQGESNRKSKDYFQKLQALSAGWSKAFGVKDMPLYQVQIAPFNYTKRSKTDSTLCDNIWAAQLKGAKEIPGVGVVAIHDTKINVYNIHPIYKVPVAERLAAMALHNNYGKDVPCKGPSFSGATLDGAKVIVSFSDIDKGLSTTDGKAPTWFELSVDGKTFVAAQAVIVGDKVEVTAAEVTAPKFVRMGWLEVALPTLNDKNGWPAFAFPAQEVK